MKAIILAAGKGERLMPITESLPKPMIPLKGKPLLEYTINLCKKYGITEMGINLSHLPEKIKEYFQDGSKWGVRINYSLEPTLLGTSGALNNFKDFIGKKEDFLIIYGDNFTDLNLEKLFEFHEQKNSLGTLVVRKKEISKKAGSMILFDEESKQIKKFIEKPTSELVERLCKDFYWSNSGIYLLSSEILKYIPSGFSDFGYDTFPKILSQKKDLYGFELGRETIFRELGTIEKYQQVKEDFESGKIKLNL